MLATIGVYGVMAFMVSGRSREIGIRLALGATAGDVLRMILRDGARLTAAGVGAGVIAAFALTRTLQTFLFETAPNDAATFATFGLVIALAAMLASFLPARFATRVNPVTASGSSRISISTAGAETDSTPTRARIYGSGQPWNSWGIRRADRTSATRARVRPPIRASRETKQERRRA